MGHSIPWAGHMAFQKTLYRIASRFVWPGMYTQVSHFCASCETCQLTSAKGVIRAQLQFLPIIDTPFERIGMDIVGPLEKSSSGHHYILVICNYATRYPEAFPLRPFIARQVAYCLLQLFSRVGIPKEILTDCGTTPRRMGWWSAITRHRKTYCASLYLTQVLIGTTGCHTFCLPTERSHKHLQASLRLNCCMGSR